jgi:tetratricopeptide (TPR) repeat protein
MRVVLALGLSVAASFAWSPSFAQDLEQSNKICETNSDTAYSPEVRLYACNAVLQSGSEEKFDFAAVRNNRGNAYLAAKNYDAAIADYDEAIRRKPDYPEAYNNRGLAYDDKGDHDAAIRDYDTAIRLKPDYSDSFNNRGVAYDGKGLTHRAMEDFDQAIALNPNDAKAFNNRGSDYYALKDYDRAIEDLDQALRLNPRSGKAFLNRGLVYEAKKDLDNAQSDFTQAVLADPTLSDPFFELGRLYSQDGDHLGAAQEFREVVKLEPKDDVAWNNLCWELALADHLGEALEDCNESLTIKPHDPDTLDTRGLVHLKRKEVTAAIADYNEALRVNPKLDSSLYGRGLAKRLQHNVAGANADIAAAKRLNPKIVSEFDSYGISEIWPAVKMVKLPVFHFALANKSSHPINRVTIIGPHSLPMQQRRGGSVDFDVVESGETRHTAWIDPTKTGTVDVLGFSPSHDCSYQLFLTTKDSWNGFLLKQNICSTAPVVVADSDLHFSGPAPAAAASD